MTTAECFIFKVLMTGRIRDLGQKYESGSQKRKRKETKLKEVESKCKKISQFFPNVNEQLADPPSIQSLSNDSQAVDRDVAAAPQTPQLGGPRPTLGAQVSLKLLFGYVTIFSSADLFTTDLNCRKKLACDIISEC